MHGSFFGRNPTLFHGIVRYHMQPFPGQKSLGIGGTLWFVQDISGYTSDCLLGLLRIALDFLLVLYSVCFFDLRAIWGCFGVCSRLFWGVYMGLSRLSYDDFGFVKCLLMFIEGQVILVFLQSLAICYGVSVSGSKHCKLWRISFRYTSKGYLGTVLGLR